MGTFPSLRTHVKAVCLAAAAAVSFIGAGGWLPSFHMSTSRLRCIDSLVNTVLFQRLPHSDLRPDYPSAAPQAAVAEAARATNPSATLGIPFSPFICDPHHYKSTWSHKNHIRLYMLFFKPSPFLSVLFNHQIFGVWLRLTTRLFVRSV